jgi:hypothetical protein
MFLLMLIIFLGVFLPFIIVWLIFLLPPYLIIIVVVLVLVLWALRIPKIWRREKTGEE